MCVCVCVCVCVLFKSITQTTQKFEFNSSKAVI